MAMYALICGFGWLGCMCGFRLGGFLSAYRSFPLVALRPIIGTLMNFLARLACSKPAQVNNPRHEATDERLGYVREDEPKKKGTYSSRRQRPSGLNASGR